jgi:hypothetical protein
VSRTFFLFLYKYQRSYRQVRYGCRSAGAGYASQPGALTDQVVKGQDLSFYLLDRLLVIVSGLVWEVGLSDDATRSVRFK